MRISGRTIRFLLTSTCLASALFVVSSLENARPARANAGELVSEGSPKETVAKASPAKQDADAGKAVYAEPEKRIALVIGNSAYENVSRLPNPANDAKAMSQFLNSAGFEVIAANDLNQDEMVQVLQDFSAKIAERGSNSVAFVYYAGHGVQIAGDNYLIPVDAKINSEADVPNEAVRLVDVMATLQAVPSRMRVVVLDACRNNPFSNLKDTGRGLAMVDAPNGSIVGYSTAPGTEALDGNGANSPYTSAFLRVGREKNLPIEQMFKKVRLAVNDATDGQQTPWESSSLTNDFYFFGDTQNAMASMVEPPAARQRTASAAANTIRTRTPREAYALAVQEDTPEYYEEFVRVYPQDPFAERIRRLLAARLLQVAWHGAVMANSPIGYKTFYSQYSSSPYANIAQKLEVQPKLLPLYQPTKILVPQQIAPQVKLTSFNGAPVPQGSNSPINWLATKKASMGQGSINGGINVGLPGKGVSPQPINAQGPAIKTAPGIDLAKNGPRFETKLDAKRITTLPQNGQPQSGSSKVMPVTKDAAKDTAMTSRERMQPPRQTADIKPVRVRPETKIGRKPSGPVMQAQQPGKRFVAPQRIQQQPRVQQPRMVNTPSQNAGGFRSPRTMSMNATNRSGGSGSFNRMSFR